MNLRLSKLHELLPYIVYALLVTSIMWGSSNGGFMWGLDMVFTPDMVPGTNSYAYGLGIFDYVLFALAKLVDAQLIQRVYVFVTLWSIPASGYFVSRKLGMSPLIAFLVGFITLWNPFVYARFVLGQMRLLLTIPFLLLALLGFWDLYGSQMQKSKHWWFVYTLLLFSGWIFSIHFLYLFGFVWVGFAAFSTAKLRDKYVLLSNLYLVSILLILGLVQILSIYKAYDFDQIELHQFVFASGSFADLWILEGNWFDFRQIHNTSEVIDFGLLSLMWGLVYAVSVYGFWTNYRESKFWWMLVFLGICSFGLAWLGGIEQGRYYQRLLELTYILWPMREAQKWILIFVLSIFLLFGLGVENICSKCNYILRYASILLISLCVFVQSYRFVGLGSSQIKVAEYPDAWYFLYNSATDQDTILVLPAHAYTNLGFVGRRTMNPAQSFFLSKVLVSTTPQEFQNKFCDIEVQTGCLNYTDDENRWREFLSQNSVDYVLLNHAAGLDFGQMKAKFVDQKHGQVVFEDEYTLVIVVDN